MVRGELVIELFGALLGEVAQKQKPVPETVFYKPKPATLSRSPKNRKQWLDNVYQDIFEWTLRTGRANFQLGEWIRGSDKIDELQSQYADVTGSTWRFYDFDDRARRVLDALVRRGKLGRYRSGRNVRYYTH